MEDSDTVTLLLSTLVAAPIMQKKTSSYVADTVKFPIVGSFGNYFEILFGRAERNENDPEFDPFLDLKIAVTENFMFYDGELDQRIHKTGKQATLSLYELVTVFKFEMGLKPTGTDESMKTFIKNNFNENDFTAYHYKDRILVLLEENRIDDPVLNYYILQYDNKRGDGFAVVQDEETLDETALGIK